MEQDEVRVNRPTDKYRSEIPVDQKPLCKLPERSKSRDDVSSALAWDDSTGMRLDAGKVIEARSK